MSDIKILITLIVVAFVLRTCGRMCNAGTVVKVYGRELEVTEPSWPFLIFAILYLIAGIAVIAYGLVTLWGLQS